MHRASLVVALSLTTGCGDMMITRRVYTGLRITVNGLAEGASAEDFVLEQDLPAIEVDLRAEYADAGIDREDIGEAVLEEFWLEADDPEGADLSFISEFSITLEADGLDPVVLASADSFPEGEAVVTTELSDADLAPYLTAPSMTLTPVFVGRPPEETTLVLTPFTFKVRARAGI